MVVLVCGVHAVWAEVLMAPVELAHNVARVGVEQQLAGIEAVPLVGPPGAVGAQAIHQAGLRPRQVTVPDIDGMARKRQARQFLFALGIEQAQFHGLGMR